MSNIEILYVKGMNNSESEVEEAEEDIWDDRKLNDAYDKALRIANAEVAKRVAMSTNSQPKNKADTANDHHKAEPSVHRKNKTRKNKKNRNSKVPEWKMPEIPFQLPHNLGSMDMPLPPPPPLALGARSESEQQAISSMLISWYMSGFYTGLYQGMKRAEGNRNNNA